VAAQTKDSPVPIENEPNSSKITDSESPEFGTKVMQRAIASPRTTTGQIYMMI
ncbi:hypothetical protein A2U01_0085575, partial [Trifolium medium]|nr:hypothetical protein [Trifolium medium]